MLSYIHEFCIHNMKVKGAFYSYHKGQAFRIKPDRKNESKSIITSLRLFDTLEDQVLKRLRKEENL